MRIEKRIITLIEPTLSDMGFEIVRVILLGQQAPVLQIMVDRSDGSLVNVEDCEQVSHAVSALLDVHDPIDGSWTLEVSSAGIDRPLVRVKDWNRFAGHLAKVETMIPIQGRRRFSGIVLGADQENARLRLNDETEAVLPISEIRKAKLVITDALIEFCAHMINSDQNNSKRQDLLEIEDEIENRSKNPGTTHRPNTH